MNRPVLLISLLFLGAMFSSFVAGLMYGRGESWIYYGPIILPILVQLAFAALLALGPKL